MAKASTEISGRGNAAGQFDGEPPAEHSDINTIQWLSPDEQGEWDAFVSAHPLGLVYHLSAWQRVLESAFGHIRGRVLVLRDADGQIRAGLPIYQVKSWLLKNRTVSVPFATMCDPLVSTREEFDLLWPAIEEAAGRNNSQDRDSYPTHQHRLHPASPHGWREIQTPRSPARSECRNTVPRFPRVLRVSPSEESQTYGHRHRRAAG